jgi:phosphate transport system substrate-binding protein
VNCVADQPDAMGYFGFSYYNDNRQRLRALAIEGPKGAVEPSIEAVQQERYIPLSRPLFLYVNDTDLRDRPEVRRFITTVVQNGQIHARQAGVIPLPTSTYMLAESKLYRHVLGTSFGGDLPVGLTIGQALSRSFDAIKKEGYR